MKLNERETGLLRLIAAGPRTGHSFTHGEAPCAPHVIQCYLDHLAELGYIEAPLRHDGKYTVTDDGLEHLANLPRLTPSTLICAASMKDPYIPPTWNIRQGGADHAQYRSLTK